jgi:transglutaminase-like putative cysteine protease
MDSKQSELAEFLKPTMLIQSQDPEIKKLAQRLVQGKKNDWDKALVLEKWVYKNLEKSMTVSLPSAVEVLRSRRGDCNEHATLYAALARAAGLPCKLCLGVVYLDGKFYYHAWNSVYCGQWIELDPAFGQAPADAARLRLVEGDLSQQTRLLSAFGNLKIEILEHTP